MKQTTPTPDMSDVHAKELKALRKELQAEQKITQKQVDKLNKAITKIEGGAAVQIIKLERKTKRQKRAIEKAAVKAAKPLWKQARSLASRGFKSERAEALAKRIEVLEGRLG